MRLISISILVWMLVFSLRLSSNCGRRTIPTKDNHDDGNGDRFVCVHQDPGNAVELLWKFDLVFVLVSATTVCVAPTIQTRCFWFGSSLVVCRFVGVFEFVFAFLFLFGDSRCCCSSKRYRNQANHNISAVHVHTRRGFIFHFGTPTETQFQIKPELN